VLGFGSRQTYKQTTLEIHHIPSYARFSLYPNLLVLAARREERKKERVSIDL
jgi:hypothetical protein